MNIELEEICVETIPAVIWGKESEKVFIASHGNMSSKSDFPIAILAEEVSKKGYQVLSFDFPKHGDRKDEETLCIAQNCVAELKKIINFAKTKWSSISIMGNSMGAYFNLLACKGETIDKALFLSPVLDMERIIDNMMTDFGISYERLYSEQIVTTPVGITLYWDYYEYVKNNPIEQWDVPTYILQGGKDELCETEILFKFIEKFNCNLKVSDNSKHYFHTEEDLKIYRDYIDEILNEN